MYLNILYRNNHALNHIALYSVSKTTLVKHPKSLASVVFQNFA